MTDVTFEKLDAGQLDLLANDLADILYSCVAKGASVGFIEPFTFQDSLDFWQTKTFPAVREGKAVLFAAICDGRAVGTVQLLLDFMPNQAHRCEVAKLLVHPDFRKRGIATSLMEKLEQEALQQRKSLITLDTRSGDQAEPLYILLDYKIGGRIPNFARAADCNRLDSTTYMYKNLV